mmetsp:Transcript_56531/g.123917  ORF Transcript_56531/g.123917 Transcript_56531/m.123917 type:complete len:417 (+) Transcript_56531:62-1312(+)|eukprot:CAMPEP_0204308720 /NCGR_PEP_ID=MMETSP0469-20131031/673_1 /ASSEMBLY_ACC=CAM_ASM_000384 /TAXON_ID=2969 /ORGANISM="Oxyrrhis marina" /LENGTH=416 /DNA_ID=CAMNT_0051288239 /DNA_START=70 /DNA_END=1320 /DNA_ORIENTATION=-
MSDSSDLQAAARGVLNRPSQAFQFRGIDFVVPTRYTDLCLVAKSLSGAVCSAEDTEKGVPVAIRKQNYSPEHKLAIMRKVLREVRILRFLKHENLLALMDLFMAHDTAGLYVVSGVMDADLAAILRSPQVLTDEHCRFFTYQILRGLKYVHTAGVVHRDLRPSNLIVDGNCDLRICSFGTARVMCAPEPRDQPTDLVATPWYRAPEILNGWRTYTEAVDLWSLGCIIAELYRRDPLLPGRTALQQLQLCVQVTGTPTREELAHFPSEKARNLIATRMKNVPVMNLREYVDDAPDSALDVLQNLLKFVPDRRMSCDDVLRHEYMQELHCPEEEPAALPLSVEDFLFEGQDCDVEATELELLGEMCEVNGVPRAGLTGLGEVAHAAAGSTTQESDSGGQGETEWLTQTPTLGTAKKHR